MPMARVFEVLRARARAASQKALREGRLVQMPCEVCQAERTEMHHDDYERPLVVRWLCRACHEAWHVRFQAKPVAPTERFSYASRPLTDQELNAVGVAFLAVKEMREQGRV